MPSIKDSYDERNGWGEIGGYLKRAALPAGTVWPGDIPDGCSGT
jgi:hypothetical protein